MTAQQQVYYRKWRPQRFGDVAGQEHVTHTLRQAVARKRLAHAYLFCGPRGTGKTSTARIFAKAVNCLASQDGDPDETCPACVAIGEGRFLDLIELDAASNRGIDEARNIREKARLSPSEGRYKIYVIDEAHGLTPQAWDALLKTIEEPPPYVIFILCTTEPHKVPATIVSRCQRYDFRRLGPEVVVARLDHICQAEGVQADTETLRTVARAAGGSLRDATNLLEQLVVSCGTTLTAGQVRELLGLVGTEHALALVKHIAFSDASAALALINRQAWEGADLRQLHRQTVDLLRALMLLQCGAKEGLDLPAEAAQELATLADKVPAPRVVRALKLLGQADLRHDAPSPLALELAVVEACLEPQETAAPAPPRAADPPAPSRPAPRVAQGVPPPAPRPAATPPQVPPASERPASPAQPHTSSPPLSRGEGPGVRAPVPPRAAPSRVEEPLVPPGLEHAGPAARLEAGWEGLVKALSRSSPHKRFNIGGLLRSVRERRLEGSTLVLVFTHKSHAERWDGEMEDPSCRRKVAQAFEKLLGAPCEVRAMGPGENGAAGPSSAVQSPLVRAAMGLGARILEEEPEGEDNE